LGGVGWRVIHLLRGYRWAAGPRAYRNKLWGEIGRGRVRCQVVDVHRRAL